MKMMMMTTTTTGDSGLIKLLCVRMQLLEFPSLHAHIVCPLLSLSLCLLRFRIFPLCVYIWLFVLHSMLIVKRGEGASMSGVYILKKKNWQGTKEEKKEQYMYKKEKITYPFFVSSSSCSSSVYSRNDCVLYRLRIELVKVIIYIYSVQLSHEIEEKNLR
jgi:hypothetical protein